MRISATGVFLCVMGCFAVSCKMTETKTEEGPLPVTGANSFNLSVQGRRDLERRAASGDDAAALRLAKYYGMVQTNSTLEVKWLRSAAQAGNRSAQYNLAYLLYYNSANRDIEVAKVWLQKAETSALAVGDTNLLKNVWYLKHAINEGRALEQNERNSVGH